MSASRLTTRTVVTTMLVALMSTCLLPQQVATSAEPGVSFSQNGSGLQALTPARLLDTRASGATVDDGGRPKAPVLGGSRLRLRVVGRGGVPEVGVSAVMLNVTAVQPSASGHLTIFPHGGAPPDTSNLNFVAGRTVANLVLAKLGRDGSIDVAASRTTHVLADVVGWYPEALDLQVIAPSRLLDTRSSGTTVDDAGRREGALDGGESRRVPVAGRAGIPRSGVGAVVVNVTAVGPTDAGHLTVYPAGAVAPNASTLNFTRGTITPNLTVVQVGAGGEIAVRNSRGRTQVLMDVLGWFPDAAAFTSLLPARVLDTRPSSETSDGGARAGGALGPSETRSVPVLGRGGVPATGVGAVVLNLTATLPTRGTHLTAFAAGTSAPETSSLNLPTGTTRANLVMVNVGSDGAVSIRNDSGAVHVIADVLGYFTDGVEQRTEATLTPGTSLAGAGDVLATSRNGAGEDVVVVGADVDLPAVGRHFAVAPNAVVPTGMSGRVTAIAAGSDGQRSVTLAPADLRDIFSELKIRARFDGEELTAAQTFVPPSAPTANSSLRSAGGATVGCNHEVFPRFSIDDITGDFTYDLLGSSRLEVSFKPTVKLRKPLAADGASCSVGFSAPPITAGIVVIELGPEISLDLSAGVTAEEVVFSAPMTIGYNNDRGNITNLSRGELLVSEADLEDDGSSWKIGVGVALSGSAKLYGVAGVAIGIGPKLNLSQNAACRTLDGAMEVTLDLVAGAEVADWGFEVKKQLFNSADNREPRVWQRWGRCPDPLTGLVPPPVTNAPDSGPLVADSLPFEFTLGAGMQKIIPFRMDPGQVVQFVGVDLDIPEDFSVDARTRFEFAMTLKDNKSTVQRLEPLVCPADQLDFSPADSCYGEPRWVQPGYEYELRATSLYLPREAKAFRIRGALRVLKPEPLKTNGEPVDAALTVETPVRGFVVPVGKYLLRTDSNSAHLALSCNGYAPALFGSHGAGLTSYKADHTGAQGVATVTAGRCVVWVTPSERRHDFSGPVLDDGRVHYDEGTLTARPTS